MTFSEIVNIYSPILFISLFIAVVIIGVIAAFAYLYRFISNYVKPGYMWMWNILFIVASVVSFAYLVFGIAWLSHLY